ncbi:hypothetical protein [Pseudoruegeria sp. HB172150]|uniref:hypothetical protein n=1 Tax=Pseudoruegeria sp. HB172150 TaxID=2721164 RepID=UPI0015549191|nr:hypothetical protein [Pseudoruegeria sp. HB172150]
MRVAIDHHTVHRGFPFRKTFEEVHLTVAFSHEEKQVIRQRGLLKFKLVDRRPANARVDDRDQKFELRVEHLMDGRTDRFLCANPSAAKDYEADLLAVLEQMKRWLDDNIETGIRTVTEF